MTQYLPPNLLALFAPRDPIQFLPPIEKHKNHRKIPYTGVAQFLGNFEDPADTPPPVKVETREERKERKRREKQERANYKLEQDLALWNPKKNPNSTSNAHNTLFVARLNYDTSESKLRKEFEYYGPIKKIVMVKDIYTGKSRGYSFIEFENERDMHAANKDANGRKIDGKRILTDKERGRTHADWRPRRLGKGLGRSRHGPSEREKKKDVPMIVPTHMIRDRDMREPRRRRSRSRSRDRRRRSRSRDKHYRDSRRNKRSRRDMPQYGEYGSELSGEFY